MSIYFVFALNMLNGVSVQASRVVLALYALELGAQPVTVGILAATFSVFPALLAVTAGKVADRFGSRLPLMVGAAGGGLGMLSAYFVEALPAVFVAAAMMGFSISIYNVSIQNLVGLLSNSENRAQHFSNNSLVGSLTNFAGPIIAGFSVEHSGHTAACLYIALITLLPLVTLAIWGNVLPKGTPRVKHTGKGIRSLLLAPGVPRTLATGSLQNTGDSLYQFYMPVYLHAIGLAPSTIGIVLSMYAAAAFVVRLVLSRLIIRYKQEIVLAFAFYIAAASLIMVPFFHQAVVLGLMSFIFGLGMGCCGPIVTMIMYGNSPEGRSGETLGLKITVNHLTKMVSPIVLGSIASAFGLFPVFWTNALMLGAAGVLSRPKKDKS